MKKKLYILFSLILFSINFNVQAHDFYAVNSDGDTIYYKITSSTFTYTVEVTFSNQSGSITDYVGEINIPSIVTHNDTTYSVNSIGTFSFSFCPLVSSVIIPNSVQYIRNYSFTNCFALTFVSIGDSVLSIGNSAFDSCINLDSLKFYASTPPTLGYNTFRAVDNSIPIYVPCNTVSQYLTNGYGSYFSNIYGTLQRETYIDASICPGETYTLNGFNVDSTGIYTLNLQTTNGCDSIVTLNLTYNHTSTDIIASICQGDIYNLYGFFADSTGIYTDTLQTINGCDSIVTLNLTVNPMPLIPTSLNLSIFQDHLFLTWQGNGDYYKVYRNDNYLASVLSTNFIDYDVVEGENYCYKIEALSNNCESEFCQEVCQVFSGLNYIGNNNLSVILYPNPTNDKVTLEVEGLTKDAKVIVYDINGREIKQYNLNAGQKELEIDVNGLAKGVYNVRIVNDNISLTRKLIVR